MLGTDDNTTILKTLTSTLNDSVNGYRDAAENAEGSQFQQIFRDNASERERVAGELAGEVRRLGGTPDEDGTVLGKTHQAFLDLKAAVTGRDNASERERVAGELAGEVRRLGGTPDEDGTVLGKTHQAFLDLKAAVTGRDDKAIINEVERGEDYLKEKFEAALAGDKLTTESREIVERAYQSVRKGHDQISQLKHGLEA